MKVKNYEEHHLEFLEERFHGDARGLAFFLTGQAPVVA
jgi:hypothetical protein